MVCRTEPGNGGGTERGREEPPLENGGELGGGSSLASESADSRGKRGARGMVLLWTESEPGMGCVSGDRRASGLAAGTTMAPPPAGGLSFEAGRGSISGTLGASKPIRVLSGPRFLEGPAGGMLGLLAPRAAAIAAVASSAIVKAGCHSFIPSRQTRVEGNKEPEDNALRSSLVGSSRSTP